MPKRTINRLTVVIEPHRHYPNEREIRTLRVETIIDGKDHLLERVLQINELESYFDLYWKQMGQELKGYLKEL